MITAIKSSDMLIEGVLDHGLTFIGDYLERILHHSVLIADHHGRIYFPEKKPSPYRQYVREYPHRHAKE